MAGNFRAISFLNQPYPFYILYQTITIILAYYMMNLDWNFGLKFGILLIGTFGFSWVIYEFLIRRWRFIRPLFGLKVKSRIQKPVWSLNK